MQRDALANGILSFIIPGLGQALHGNRNKGIMLFVGMAFCLILIISLMTLYLKETTVRSLQRGYQVVKNVRLALKTKVFPLYIHPFGTVSSGLVFWCKTTLRCQALATTTTTGFLCQMPCPWQTRLFYQKMSFTNGTIARILNPRVQQYRLTF